MKNGIKNSEDFLKQAINKDAGFSVPKNYFSDAEDRFSSFMIEEKLPNKNGFSIPNNYFEGLENTILHKVSTEKEVKVISFKSKILKYIPVAVAASVALFISLNYFNPTSVKEVNFDAIAQADIENWITENAVELSNEDFETVLHSEIDSENDFAFIELKDTDIEDYMLYSENASTLMETY